MHSNHIARSNARPKAFIFGGGSLLREQHRVAEGSVGNIYFLVDIVDQSKRSSFLVSARVLSSSLII